MKSFQARALCESKVKQTKKPQPNRTYKACTESLKTIMLLKINYNKVNKLLRLEINQILNKYLKKI